MPSMTKAGYRPESAPPGPKTPSKKPGNTGKKKGKKKRGKVNRAAVASIAIFLTAFLIGVGTLHVFSVVERSADVFVVGPMLSGHPLGGMTAEEGTALLQKLTAEQVASWRYDITCQGRTYSATAEDIGLFIDEQATLEPLWQIGKTGGMLERYAQIFKAKAERVNMQPVFGYTMEFVDALLLRIEEETNCDPVDATVRFVPGNSEPFRFTDDQMGYALNAAPLRTEIEKAILALTAGSKDVIPEERKPAVTRASLEAATILRSRVTSLLHDDENAAQNVRMAAAMLNGLCIGAGKTVSFNEVVGRRTSDGGYLSAPEQAYGEGIVGIGGGICQASTALYQAALLAGLAVEERNAAARPVSYCEMGQEAVVSDQGLDLVIRNTTEAPVFITARVYSGEEDDVLEIQLIGEAIEGSYMLVSLPAETEMIDEPVYVRDSAGTYATYTDERVPVGEAKPGYSSIVERVLLSDAGEEIQRETISENVYEPVAPTIYVGVNDR